MKKIVLALSLSLALLAGCSQGASPSASPEPAAAPESSGTSTAAEAPAAPSTSFPEKEITIVVGAAAGGASDMTARIMAKGIEAEIGKPVVVVNKPGGSCSVGMMYAAGSAPDGYTVMYLPVELSMVRPAGIADIGPEAFDYICGVTMVPAALTVPIDAPYNTAAEFIEYAKAHPGEVRIGNSGAGSIWHIAASSLEEGTGADFNHIPFEGAAPAVTALMGKHIEAVTVNSGEVKAGIDAGSLKILALMTEERDPAFPDVPTLKENGIDVVVNAWGGFGVPKGTPKEVIDVLVPAFEKAATSDEFLAFINERGIVPTFRNPSDFQTFAEDQLVFFTDMLKTLDLGN